MEWARHNPKQIYFEFGEDLASLLGKGNEQIFGPDSVMVVREGKADIRWPLNKIISTLSLAFLTSAAWHVIVIISLILNSRHSDFL